MNSFHKLPSAKDQSGVIIIEVMIALLLFLVGILGIVGLQVVSAKTVNESRFRTEAAAYADELVGKMQAGNSATVPSTFATGGADFSAWLSGRVSNLPNGDATVEFTTETRPVATIVVLWTMPGESVSAGRGVSGYQSRHVTQVAIGLD